MNEVFMTTPFITLTQFLKMTDLISSGGEAKYFLAEYGVLLNSEVEQRRGKKLYPGDIITVLNEQYLLIYDKDN